MSEIQERSDDTERLEAATAFARADLACTFGPSFFLGHLGRFVRDHCPDPKENLPVVQVHLADGARARETSGPGSFQTPRRIPTPQMPQRHDLAAAALPRTSRKRPEKPGGGPPMGASLLPIALTVSGPLNSVVARIEPGKTSHRLLGGWRDGELRDKAKRLDEQW